jgi:cytochrome bd-type quinol oxidase subunit 1
MTSPELRDARNVYRILAGMFATICVYFTFHTVRLLVVTEGLRATRPGGYRAYAFAVVFPLLAIVCGWLSVRWFRRSQRIGSNTIRPSR